MTKSFVAADTSAPLECFESGIAVIGRGVMVRLRSTDWDRFVAVELLNVVDKCVGLFERDSKGDANLLELEDEEEVVVVVVVVVVEVEVEVEVEGDMYLEETCLPLGLLG